MESHKNRSTSLVLNLFFFAAFLIFGSYQCKAQEYHGDVNYKDVTEIKDLIYFRADTTLVTGKVIRYNKKKVAKRYIMVRNGKPDVSGWIYFNEKYESPKESGLGTLVTSVAKTTGAVMDILGNDIDVPLPINKANTINKSIIQNDVNDILGYNKEIAAKANDDMLRRNEISKNIEPNIYSAQTSEPSDELYHKYYEDGQLEIIGSYIDNKKNGIWEKYHSNGKLKSKGVYNNNVKDGLWEEYYENEKLKEVGSYKDGKEIGEWKYYDEEGKLLFTENYDN